MGSLAGIAACCADTGNDLETSVLLDDEIIEQYVQSLNMSRASKSDKHKTLKHLGEALNDTWEGSRKYIPHPVSDRQTPTVKEKMQVMGLHGYLSTSTTRTSWS